MTIKPGYIRVSTILGQWDRFAGIQKEILEKKAELGKAVHEAIIAHHDNISLYLDKGKGYFESFTKWLACSKATFVHYGERLYCDNLKITGEIDAIVKFPGSEELVLIDWKTSASVDDRFWAMQGQFYIYLCAMNGFCVSDRFLFIQLNKEGEMPKVREYKISSALLNVCMSAYVCYKYINKVD